GSLAEADMPEVVVGDAGEFAAKMETIRSAIGETDPLNFKYIGTEARSTITSDHDFDGNPGRVEWIRHQIDDETNIINLAGIIDFNFATERMGQITFNSDYNRPNQ
ncbi:hypothetical protein BVX93_02195, partial [bacterium B13(2017)]